MPLYRKKPVEVQALQIPPIATTLSDEWIALRDGAEKNNGLDRAFKVFPYTGAVEIDTLEGIVTAHSGAFVISGVNGELYPCAEDIFNKTYDLVEDSAPERFVGASLVL